MKAFAQLFEKLDATTSTSIKVAAMQAYFESAPPRDAAWAVYVLSGRRLKRLVGARELRQWLQQAVAYPDWLIEDAYAAVGDLAETIALLLASPANVAAEARRASGLPHPATPGSAGHEAPSPVDAAQNAAIAADEDASLADWMEQRLPSLREADAQTRRLLVTRWWLALDPARAFLVTKLLTGGLRVGVSRLLVARALADVAGVPRSAMQHRLMGQWQPGAAWFTGLLQADAEGTDASQPYPFFLASPLQHDEDPATALGDRGDWQAEWKWDGIRAQCIRRGGQTFIWSRGEELVTDRYPEVAAALEHLPEGSVLDGELVAWREGEVLSFAALQRRIGRREPSRRLCEEVPVRLLAYDLLEWQGRDQRAASLLQRRALLAVALAGAPPPLGLSPVLQEADWPALALARERSRELGVEGLMLKRLDAGYAAGRVRGAWWKWKIEPLTLDAVMIYAQAGHGRRASLHTDYTFAVWQDEELVPVAKAYSGLSDAEITRLDRWIRRHTQQRFGPVRQVAPLLVFELAFEGIARSPRHRAGMALRFPRILRWREDLGPHDADRLEDVAALLAAHER